MAAPRGSPPPAALVCSPHLADVDAAATGELASDRGIKGGHRQEVGHQLALATQPLALRHPEAVLLVHDDQAEVAEGNVVLDERVGA